MITKETEALLAKGISHAKKASILLGAVTKDDKFVTGTVYDDLGDVEIGDAIFETGSVTKTFTSLLLAKLVLNKTIGLDEPVSAFKPEYRRALSYKGKDVTFRHLSAHLSGLPRDDGKKVRQLMKKHKKEKDNLYHYYTEEDFTQFFADFDLKKEIGKKWGYSNLAAGLLGNTLGEILGQTYEEALSSEILQPLGMTDTFITGNAEQNERYVKSYNKKGKAIPPLSLPAMNGAGALRSTVNDMLKYLAYQMNIVEGPLRKEMDFTHHIHGKTQMKNFNMGLGWVIERRKWSPYPLIHHDGATFGFYTYTGFIKEKQVGVVVSSTAPIRPSFIFKALLGLAGRVHEDIAKTIFINHLNRKDRMD